MSEGLCASSSQHAGPRPGSVQVQEHNFTIVILEQSPELLFNRGALLNAGFQLLQGSDYDHFAFQDVDTLPTFKGKIQYSYPKGEAPLHLTPFRIHPAANFQVTLESFLPVILCCNPAQKSDVSRVLHSKKANAVCMGRC